jgi:hypothetical protein
MPSQPPRYAIQLWLMRVFIMQVLIADDVAVGSFTVQAESIFSQLIPSSQTETPLLDLNAVSENPAFGCRE